MRNALVSTPRCQLLSFEKRQAPSTSGALSVDVLLAHSVPNHIVIGEITPSTTDLSGFAEGESIEVCEDLVG
jgi:hypothetical protein